MPTAEAYGHWQSAFAFFNDRLFAPAFGSALPNALITLTRHPGALGYFCAGAFADGEGAVAHEISMNPSYFAARGDAESYATLAHEMCHLCRHVYGALNRKGGTGVGGYHDAVWADIMERIGLMPSHTGGPGGRRTGYAMTHYVIEGGPFDLACRELLVAGHTINWRDAQTGDGGPMGPGDPPSAAAGGARQPKNTRTRFVCCVCDLRAWSRASAKLSCNDCNLPLIAR